jgi:hypothetical protein
MGEYRRRERHDRYESRRYDDERMDDERPYPRQRSRERYRHDEDPSRNDPDEHPRETHPVHTAPRHRDPLSDAGKPNIQIIFRGIDKDMTEQDVPPPQFSRTKANSIVATISLQSRRCS